MYFKCFVPSTTNLKDEKLNYNSIYERMIKMMNFLKKAFSDMKASAKMQHKIDKANFEAVKAESQAHFEENRGKNTFKRAKENSKTTWNNVRNSTSPT